MASPWKVSVLKWSDILAWFALYMMMDYLTDIWNLNFTHAASIINFFSGLIEILPIAMRLIKDHWKIHNRWMVLFSSIAYTTGLGFLAMSALDTTSKKKGARVKASNKALFFAALPLIVIAKSGFAASLEELIADQKRGILSKVLFGVIGTLVLVLICLVGGIIKHAIKSWSIRFGVPAICMALSTLIFLTGIKSFRRDAAKPGFLTGVYNLFATCVPCLSSSQNDTSQPAPEPQRNPRQVIHYLISSHSKAKFIMSVIPLCLLGVVSSFGNTYFVEQGTYMKRKIIGPLRVPPLILPLFYYLTKLGPHLCFTGINCCPSPCLRRWCHRIGIALSLVLALLCCVTAAGVETRRLDLAKSHGLNHKEPPVAMLILYLVPQFVLLGGLDGMAHESIKRFFKKEQENPEFMKPYMVDLVNGVFGMGKIVNVLLAYLVDKITENGDNPEGWFADNLNKSRLDNYYWLLAVLTAFNCLWYLFVALLYPPKETTQNPSSFCCTSCSCCPRPDVSCCQRF